MEVNTKSILQMAGGAIMERVDYEMPLIVANISDPNTPTKVLKWRICFPLLSRPLAAVIL